MSRWLNLGQHLKINAKKFPKTTALCDANRSFTYPEVNERVNKLANGLLSIGLAKGDKISVFMENSIEIVELFLAAAKTGIIIVPINFRLVSREIEYIANNSEAKAFFVDHEFTGLIDPIKDELYNILPDHYFAVGEAPSGYRPYEELIRDGAPDEPIADVAPEDTWILIYTSGTTGNPKGVIRSHESHVAFYLINAVDFGFNEFDVCMNVMPLCHINSTFFTFTFLYVGGSVYIHPARSFKPEQIMEIVEREKITFISLIPTHYNLILNVSDDAKAFDRSSIRKLLCSSAPASKQMKKDIMAFFPGVELYEGYGSTEAGIVTVLKPRDQMRKLGSIGMESLGTEFVRLLDLNGDPVPVGEVGELYSCGPMLFDEYYNLPEKTAESFNKGWFSAGDLAKQDEDGYFFIVDRKDNMIITGGENVYPTEIEEVISGHPSVFDVAVIGLPDDKWGEKIAAVIIKRPESDITEQDLLEWCRTQMAGYKRPKKIIFVTQKEMPRTASGKIQHGRLKEKFKD
ncbi:MAG: AMP-binding protein [Desulfobacteraceae bacterium]|nr:AMP-binding protein [Desulfobacteraceae bacterium]